MNIIGDNTYQYHNIQFQNSGNQRQGATGYPGMLAGNTDTKDSRRTEGMGMPVWDAYASMSHPAGNRIMEDVDEGKKQEKECAKQIEGNVKQEECAKQIEGNVKQEKEMIGGVEADKVTDIWVLPLFSKGINLYYNEDTGELKCVELGRADARENPLWSKRLSWEEYEKCSEDLFVCYPYEGHWKFPYEPYLDQEKFWDMYLTGEYAPETLAERFNAAKQLLT